MNFFVGQQVVCLRDGWLFWQGYKPLGWPIAGYTYTIRSLNHDNATGLGLRLFEITNPNIHHIGHGLTEPAFAVESDGIANFRPVVERKTDISIFTKLLAPTPKEREPA